MRPLDSKEQEALKAATAASYDAIGGVTRAADAIGVASSTLTKYASTGSEWVSSYIRLDLAVALDRRTSHPFFLDAMSRLVRNEPIAPATSLTPTAVLKLDGVLDDVVREVVRAIEDGRIDAAERAAVRSRIVAAQQDLARLFSLMGG
nr:phage regulatory CII family protein [Neorhizobium tomejilense]